MGADVERATAEHAKQRVLFIVRENLTQHPGGDTTQILKTADALRERGHVVELRENAECDLAAFDIAHLFHLDRIWENLPHARRVRAARRPLVLSTIYWPSDEFDRGGRAGFQGWLARRVGSARYQSLRLFQRHLLECVRRRRWPILKAGEFAFAKRVRELLELVDVILPNSNAEREQVEKRFDVRRPAVVVPNAADAAVFSESANAERRGVLCVGRLEPRKNQLALIKALAGTEISLTLVGGAGRFSDRYARRCQRAASANVQFVSQQSPEQLQALYRSSVVHACVSWYETPGLASLEAALCGCALVVTPGGSTREYFGDDVHYAEPDDRASIRMAVEGALAAGASRYLAGRIATDYTWRAAAEKTEEAYRLASEQSGRT